MGKNYEEFREYRGELTEEDRIIIQEGQEAAARALADLMKPEVEIGPNHPNIRSIHPNGIGYLDPDGKMIYKPEAAGYLDLANIHAQSVLADAKSIYLGKTDYYGISMDNVYTEVDLELKQKLEEISHSFAVQNEEFRNLFAHVPVGIRESDDPQKKLVQEQRAFMGERLVNAQSLDLISKVCYNEQISEEYENLAKEQLENGRNTLYPKFMTCLAYAAGMGDELPPELKNDEKLNNFLTKLDTNQDALERMHQEAQSYDLTKPLDRITFNMVDMNRRGGYLHYQNPKNWNIVDGTSRGYGRTDWDFETPEIAAEMIDKSLSASANNSLDPLFVKLENSHPFYGKVDGINRAKLIVVGGKTVEEIMREEHLKKMTGQNMDLAGMEGLENFDDYFAKNYQRDTNRIVAAGMAADKRVDVFIPDQQGNIAQPVQMVKRGVEPTPLTPIAHKGWRTFMSNFGFYKDSMQRQKEYETTLSKFGEVRENIAQAQELKTKTIALELNKDDVADRRALFCTPDQLAQLKGSDIKFTYSRGSIPSFCTTRMLMEGHSLESLLDPNQLQEEKLQMGAQYVEKVMTKDTAWFAETLVKGQPLLREQVDRTIQKHGGINQLTKSFDMPVVNKVAGINFDLTQEQTALTRADKTCIAKAAFQFMVDDRGMPDLSEVEKNTLGRTAYEREIDLAQNPAYHIMEKSTELVATAHIAHDSSNGVISPFQNWATGKNVWVQAVVGQTFDELIADKQNSSQPFSQVAAPMMTVANIPSYLEDNKLLKAFDKICKEEPSIADIANRETKNKGISSVFEVELVKDPSSQMVTDVNVLVKDGPVGDALREMRQAKLEATRKREEQEKKQQKQQQKQQQQRQR